MNDIPSGIAAVLGSLVGVIGTCAAARWAYLAATCAADRKDRIAQIRLGIADLLSAFQILAFSCRHHNKQPEDEIDIYERARLMQTRLLVLIDPTVKGGNELIDSMEEAFGKLKTKPPPSKEDIELCSAAILTHGKTVIDQEQCLLKRGK